MFGYNPDHRGIGQLLKSGEMLELVESVAQGGAEYARSIAPVASGEYAGSFEVASEVLDDRATGIIYNTAPHGALVEWGFNQQEGAHVLARTADFIEAGG